jgi:hypothetical protein
MTETRSAAEEFFHRPHPELARSACCGAALDFDTDWIGRLLEICSGCGRRGALSALRATPAVIRTVVRTTEDPQRGLGVRQCAGCEAAFEPITSNARWCDACRKLTGWQRTKILRASMRAAVARQKEG